MKTELRILVNSLHQLTQEDHIDELEGGVIDEAANALSCQASRIQQLEGEAKVLRDLLKMTVPAIETTLPEADHPYGEHESLSGLLTKIDTALRGAS